MPVPVPCDPGPTFLFEPRIIETLRPQAFELIGKRVRVNLFWFNPSMRLGTFQFDDGPYVGEYQVHVCEIEGFVPDSELVGCREWIERQLPARWAASE